jgi:hypothetical protein
LICFQISKGYLHIIKYAISILKNNGAYLNPEEIYSEFIACNLEFKNPVEDGYRIWQ